MGLERISIDRDNRHPMPTVREHLSRYIFALQDVPGRDILDIACGTGYGSFLMSFWAKSVSGYDYSEEAIEELKDNFDMRCPSFFEVRDLEENTDLSNEMVEDFNVITCFETLEHLANPEEVIQSISEHLRKGGIFYFSTPNKPDLEDNNEHHKTAFNISRWTELLDKYFQGAERKIWTQNNMGFVDNGNRNYIFGRVQL